MLDGEGQIIYVGKAKNLKNRVRQYFTNATKTDKVMAMVKNIADFYYIIAPSEIDALSLENNLIKKHKPRYNILLKDDKMYPYIKLTLNEDFPTLRVTRKKFNDGAKYYGPYTNALAVKDTVDFLNQTFKLKHCRKIFKTDKKETPCLNYHIKKCLGICTGNVSKEEYRKLMLEI